MIVAYLVVLICAILFRFFHLPGVALLILLSVLLPAIDIVVQFVQQNPNKRIRILSAVSVQFWAIYILLRFLYWSDNYFIFGAALLFSISTCWFYFKDHIRNTWRISLFLTIVFFGIFNFSQKNSSLKLMYSKEDPFDEDDHIPCFFIHELAFDYYQEGAFDKATILLKRCEKHLLMLQKRPDEKLQCNVRIAIVENLTRVHLDLKHVENRTWNNFVPMYKKDAH